MRNASDPRLVLEVAFTRLARPEADLTLEALSERIDVLEKKLASGAYTQALPQEQEDTTSKTKTNASNPSIATVSSQVAPTSHVSTTTDEVIKPNVNQRQASTPPAQTSAAAQPTGRNLPVTMMSKQDLNEMQRKWQAVVAKVVATAPSRGSLLQQVHILDDTGETLVLKPSNMFTGKMIMRPETHTAMMPAVTAVFGPRTIELSEADAPKHQTYAPQPMPSSVMVPTAEVKPQEDTSLKSTSQSNQDVHVEHEVAPVLDKQESSVDATSAPTVMPEAVDIDAARDAWVDDYVPYEDDVQEQPSSQTTTSEFPAPSVVPATTQDDLPWNSSNHSQEDIMAVLGEAFGDGVKLMDN